MPYLMYRFQSTPAITGGRDRAYWPRLRACRCFNPRPPLLAGETARTGRGSGRADVSIHARHYWRARRAVSAVSLERQQFQSTPAITGGRDVVIPGQRFFSHVFQSTPAITGGRDQIKRPIWAPSGFSIHARHYWRARPKCISMSSATTKFQSTPAITGGRDATASALSAWPASFNPRPPLLAGETR